MEAAIQSYLRQAASRGRDSEQVGPFLATFSKHTDLIYLNYAIPDDNAVPFESEVAALIAACEKRNRTPRLEYLPNLAPGVEPVLLQAGFTIEGRLPVMVYDFLSEGVASLPSGIEILRAESDADFLATLQVQFEAYGETASPSHDDISRLRSSVAAGGIVVYARDADGEPAGAGICGPPFGGITELAGIGVRDVFRRRGIAGAVTAQLAREAHAAGTKTIFLTPADEAAERIYQRVGFQTVSQILHISKKKQITSGAGDISVQWEDYKAEFVFDGALRDLYVFQTTIEDWQTILDFLRISGYLLTYTADGIETPLPQTAVGIFKARDQVALTLLVRVGPMAINCHFFNEDDIEFDIDPREIQTETHARALFVFIRQIGQILNKEVILTPENSWGDVSEVRESEVMFRFYPDTGQIQHLPTVTQRVYPY